MRNVFGMRMVLDTQSFVTGAKVGARALASMEYVAGRTSKKLAFLGKELEAVGYVAGAGLVAAAGAAFQSRVIYEKFIGPGIELATAFDKQLRQLYYLSGLNAGDALAQGLKSEIEQRALKSSLNPAEVTQGINELIKTGIDAVDARSLTQPLIDLVESSFGEIDPQRAGRLMGLMMLKFKRPKDVGVSEWGTKLGDMSTALSQLTHLNLTDIESIMGSMSTATTLSPASSASDFFAFFKMLSDASMKAKRQGMNVDSFTNSLLDLQVKLDEGIGSEKALRGAEHLHIKLSDLFTTLPDGQQAMKSLPDLIGTVVDALPGMIKEYGTKGKDEWIKWVNQMFGVDVGTRMALLAESFEFKLPTGEILKGTAALKAMSKSFDEMKGNTKEAADAYRKSWEGVAKQIQGAYETFMALVGEEMLKILADLIMNIKDATANLVTFTQQSPKIRTLIAALLMVTFGFGMVSATIFSALSMFTMFLIFAGPGLLSFAQLIKKAGASTVDLARAIKTLRNTDVAATRMRIRDHRIYLEQLKKEHKELIATTKLQRKKKMELSHDIGMAESLIGRDVAALATVKSMTIGLVALVVVAAIVVVALTAILIAGLAIYRLFTSPLFTGKGGFMDGWIRKFNIIGNVFQGLRELFSQGFISEKTGDKLNKEGGWAWVDKIVKILYRLKEFWKGFSEGIDFSFFDEALKTFMEAFGPGGPMDAPMEKASKWKEWRDRLAAVFNALLWVLGATLILLSLSVRLYMWLGSVFDDNITAIQAIAVGLAIVIGAVLILTIVLAALGGILMFIWSIGLLIGALFVLTFMLPVIIIGLWIIAIIYFWDEIVAIFNDIGLFFKVLWNDMFAIIQDNLGNLQALGMGIATLMFGIPGALLYGLIAFWPEIMSWIDSLIEKIKTIPQALSDGMASVKGFIFGDTPGGKAPASTTTVPKMPATPEARQNAGEAQYQTINVHANITVPPETPPNEVGKELGKQLGELLKKQNNDNRGYATEFS